MMNLQGKPILCHFFRGGRYVRPWFSQLFFHKSGEFLCSLERKFPKFFKTHPPFVCSPLLMPSTACQTLIPLFLGTPCRYEKEQGYRKCNLIIYDSYLGTLNRVSKCSKNDKMQFFSLVFYFKLTRVFI